MPDPVPPLPESRFYSEPRFAGTAESVIGSFALALRGLLRRTADDLRSGRRGPFASPTEAVFAEPLAAGVERGLAHADAFESLTLESALAHESATLLRTVIANVLSDSGFIAAAQTHNGAQPAQESKFDEQRGGDILESLGDIADKLWQLADIFTPIALLLNIIAAILRDLGLLGKLPATVATNKIAAQVEAKLLNVNDFVLMLPEALSGIKSIQRSSAATEAEVHKIELKADALGSLLGRTLVSEGWVVDPSAAGFTSNRVPAKGVKDELHDIEDLLNIILQRLPPIVDEPPPPPNGDPLPKFDKPRGKAELPVLRDARLKKIFLWAQNTFSPVLATEERVIEVQTPAFDLSGWVDLTNLRAGDEVEILIDVSIAGRPPARFAQTRFAQPGLKSFAELCRGLNYISGNDVRITLRQPVSADVFATSIELAYQFIVESM
jgi:hypothetical protein